MTCPHCSKCGSEFHFDRGYAPEEFLEGKQNSPVLIVALNPKYAEPKYKIEQTKAELEKTFDDENKIHPFFKNYRKVSPILFNMLGKDHGVAHTDIVKCLSRTFPPENCGQKERKEIINNCRPYFEKQLQELKPKLIICNGRDVCEVVKEIIPNSVDEPSYRGNYKGADITVVLSGFIGRIDDYAKRRLGIEIERYMKKLGIV